MNHMRIKVEIYRIQSAIPHDIVDFDSCPGIIFFLFNEKRCFSNLFLARVWWGVGVDVACVWVCLWVFWSSTFMENVRCKRKSIRTFGTQWYKKCNGSSVFVCMYCGFVLKCPANVVWEQKQNEPPTDKITHGNKRKANGTEMKWIIIVVIVIIQPKSF